MTQTETEMNTGAVAAVPTLQSSVGGRWRGSGRLTADINPANPAETVAEVDVADAGIAAEAVLAAGAAFRDWSARPAPARGEVLRRAADILSARADGIARDFSREEGKPLAESTGEVGRAVAVLRYFAGQTLEPDGETYPSQSPTTFLFARREPVGVVSIITPWNFPIAIPTWKIAPALAYGNTVAWKPAEIVPHTAVHLATALMEAGLPDGVLNLVLGRGSEVGDVLVGHPEVRAVSFTGSNAVGRAIQAGAAARGTKVQLELGGKNPALVMRDADLAHAAEQVARGAFLSTGQKCTATSRVMVEVPVIDEFRERLVAIAESWKVGDPLDPSTKLGPLASEFQFETVTGYLEAGARDGARAVAGGGAARDEGGGFFVQPTVFTGAAPDSRIATEEIFGPVVTLLPVSGYEEGVRMANDTVYGLTASIFTSDLGQAMRFLHDSHAGVVKINQETAGVELQAPFGGVKESSSGSREQGKTAREFFTEWKTVYIEHVPPSGA
jgi:acyl-CoA reductase-like NAD-dependent aldehyde dehydrogenase